MAALDRVLVPLPTPFTDDTTTLSEIRFARALEFHREAGAYGVVVGGAAGEGASLSFSERKALVDIAVRSARTLPVYVAMQVATTAAALDLCRHAGDVGVKGAIVALPTQVPLLQDEIEAFITTLRRHSTIPVGVIGVPSEPGPVALAPTHLEGSWKPWRVFSQAMTDEWQIGDLVCTPLAVLGVARLGILLGADEKTKTAALSLCRHGYAVRLSRAVMEHFGLDIGPPRSPLGPLSEAGKELMKVVLESTTPRT